MISHRRAAGASDRRGAGRNHWGVGRGSCQQKSPSSHLTLTPKCLSSSQQIAQISSVLCRTAPAQWTLMSSARWWWPSRSPETTKKLNLKIVIASLHLRIKVDCRVFFLLKCCRSALGGWGQHSGPEMWAFPMEIIGPARHLLQADSCTFCLCLAYWLSPSPYTHVSSHLYLQLLCGQSIIIIMG